MGRLIVISNRVASPEKGQQASGGLAVGVMDALRGTGGLWFGWSGKLATNRSGQPQLVEADGLTYATVDLTREDRVGYYDGMSNATLWPLFHYRLDLMHYTHRDYTAYQEVNRYFADSLAPMLRRGDRIWVHDYHLIPLAARLRDAGITEPIGFFLHTPFPAYALLATLPRHRDLLEALFAYDLVGFQTAGDLTAFHDAVIHGAGGAVLADGRVAAFGRSIRAGVFPIGVDPDAMAKMAVLARTTPTLRRFQESLRDRALVIGVDRLDYSKGLEHRFEAFACFLERHAEWRGKVRLMQIATATRGDVPEYRALRQRLGALAGDIAGRFSELDWSPIQYLNRSFSHRSLAGFFRLSRVALVTPLRDGMNLVAKEYVAAQDPEDPGVLVLSPFAGAADELDGAIMANPYDPDAVAEALHEALQMPRDERLERWQGMMAVLRRNSISAWRESFLQALDGQQDPG